MKSMAIRKKATEIRLWERSSSGMPDSKVVPLTRPPVWGPSRYETAEDADPEDDREPQGQEHGEVLLRQRRSS